MGIGVSSPGINRPELKLTTYLKLVLRSGNMDLKSSAQSVKHRDNSNLPFSLSLSLYIYLFIYLYVYIQEQIKRVYTFSLAAATDRPVSM
jgi:hypothetical protein